MPRQTTRSQPGGSGCEASTSELGYDARGNVTSRVDFSARRSCHAFASDRSVETYRVEGLAQADACPADLSTYQVPANLPVDKPQRKITTTWHPLWKLEAQRAEPKLITTTVYNGQVDPVDPAHPTLLCAPAAPALPDGSLIAVVCKRYEQATADEIGNLGFAAAPIDKRSWSYQYNQYGQVTQETDPRGKLTTYEYWADTSFPDGVTGHWLGDLKTVTNALGQKTQYLSYNKRGQPLTIQQPNGSTEAREYHVRGWLSKVTQTPAGGGVAQVTQYDYYATGLLKQVTQPDGNYVSYTYDPAHRLTDVADLAGNSVHYVLDNAGNRLEEQYRGTTTPPNEFAKTITRTFDALGRMNSQTGAQ